MEEEKRPKRCMESAQQGEGWQRDLYDWLQLLVVVLVIVVGLFTFVVGVVRVDGSSMYPTLEHGDLMLVQRMAYTPEQGDVVVLRKENAFQNRAIVKRVIATGGQEVYIDYGTNTVTVDGQVLEEPYLNFASDPTYGDDYMDLIYGLDPQYINQTFVVPEGSLFVCGDNRNHSSDSRVAELGMVDERYVIGGVMMIAFPFRNAGVVNGWSMP